MNNPQGVSPSKGKQGTTRGKEKIFLSSTIIYTSELILWFHYLCLLRGTTFICILKNKPPNITSYINL